MTTQIKTITLRAKYEGDLRGLNDDIAKLKSIGRNLDKNNPFKIRPSLDLSGIRADAKRAAKEFNSAFQSSLGKGVTPGSSVSKGGIIIPASAAKSAKQTAAAVVGSYKTITRENGDLVKSFAQLERGIQKVTSVSSKGVASSQFVNTKPLENFKRQLDLINKQFAKPIGDAKGNKGDLAAVLEQKQKRLADVLSGNDLRSKFTGKNLEQKLVERASITSTPTYLAAEKKLAELEEKIASARGTQTRTASKQSQSAASLRATNFVTGYDRQQNLKVQASKAEESTARLIDNRIVREKKLNRILDAREKLLQEQINKYRELEAIAAKAGNSAAARKYRIAGDRINNDLGRNRLDRTRASDAGRRSESDLELQQKLNRVSQQYRIARENLKAQEDAARKDPNKRRGSAALEDVFRRRRGIQGFAQDDVAGIQKEAQKRGLSGLASQAGAKLTGITSQGIGDMKRLAAATNKSGHAFDFHSNALLRNAATFVKWYVPAQAAMKAFGAVGFGISSAIEAQRTFKILGAVYQGTTEEAKTLADQTLMLAAANGRDSQEAAASVVAWARLGLTRTQALMAVETSLRAANVAEVSAAEATAYLTANYKAFGQTIADIPATLDFINSLSNKNAVAPKQIFEGLARGGKVAKQAGLELESVAAIIATVTATTQRPGSEVGNTIKTGISRLARPEIQKDLKQQFGFDITTATGEAKKMEQVLGELAAIYPTLNSLEQARLLNIVAGANQANRFAIVLDTWNEKLVAQAVAETDANSAMRENAQILDSVDAKLKKLSTTWTRFFYSLGEAGAFDFLGKAIDDAGMLVDILSRITIPGSDGGVKPGSTQKKLTPLESFILETRADGGISSLLLGGNFKGIANQRKDVNGRLNLSDKEIQDLLPSLQGGIFEGVGNSIKAKSLDNTNSALYKDELAKLASDTVEQRKNISASTNSAQFFENISKSFGAKGSDANKTLELFDKATANLANIPGAAALGTAATRDLRPLLEGGRTEEARAGLGKLAYDLRQNSGKQFESYSTGLAGRIDTAQDRIKATEEQLAKLRTAATETSDPALQKNIQSQLAATSELIREQKNSLATLKDDYQKEITNPFTDDMRERLEAFTSDVTLAAEAYGRLIEGFANTGFSGLDSKLKLGGALLERNMIGQTLESTLSENSLRNATDQQQIAKLSASRISGGIQDNTATVDPVIDELTRGIEARNTAAVSLETRLGELDAATAETVRKIELERQTAILRTSYEDSRSRTGSSFSQYDIGASEGERLTNRTSGIFREIGADIANPALGAGNATRDAAELGALTERLTQGKAGLFAMEARQNQIISERANMENEILETSRKQSAELSKRLQLASREDQLLAASSARVLRNSGKSQYSAEEFQYFSQNTRNTLSNLAPRSVQGMDDVARDASESRGKLDREYNVLSANIQRFAKEIEILLPKAEQKGGNLLGLDRPYGPRGPSANAITDSNKDEVRMQLNTGPVSIAFDMAPHIPALRDLLQVDITRQISEGLASIRRSFNQGAAPNTSAAAGVQ